jgi:glycosyltransferase involved in cell wall biosynthesis
MRIVSRLPGPFFELIEIAYNAVVAWRLGTYLHQHPDVDFIYERYSLFLFSSVLIARWRRVPIILEVNDSAIVERVRPLFLKPLAMAMEGWIFRNCNGMVFVSSVFRDRVAEAHGSIAPAIVTPNAANIDKFSFTQEQRALARANWGLEGYTVCGYLGAFVPWHAIDRFVLAIADHLSQAPHLKLLLVGDGATFDAVRDFVAQRKLTQQIVLTGRVAHDDVPGLLAAMDMAVLPSAGDYTSPVKLFEFMACAIPPIAPDLDPIREVLKEGKTGWMFTANDLEAAVRRVLDLSREPATLRHVGAAARAFIAAERQWRNNVLQLVEFFLTLRQGP